MHIKWGETEVIAKRGRFSPPPLRYSTLLSPYECWLKIALNMYKKPSALMSVKLIGRHILLLIIKMWSVPVVCWIVSLSYFKSVHIEVQMAQSCVHVPGMPIDHSVYVAHWNVYVAHWHVYVAHWNVYVAHWHVYVAHWNVYVAHWSVYVAHWSEYVAHWSVCMWHIEVCMWPTLKCEWAKKYVAHIEVYGPHQSVHAAHWSVHAAQWSVSVIVSGMFIGEVCWQYYWGVSLMCENYFTATGMKVFKSEWLSTGKEEWSRRCWVWYGLHERWHRCPSTWQQCDPHNKRLGKPIAHDPNWRSTAWRTRQACSQVSQWSTLTFIVDTLCTVFLLPVAIDYNR